MKHFKFHDMYSGGGLSNPPFRVIIIEAACLEEAVEIFGDNGFGDPYHVSCDCCGEDYSVIEADEEDMAEIGESVKYIPAKEKFG